MTYNSACDLRGWRDVDLGEVQWIVVDNASSDESAQVAKELGARVVRLPVNRGFSAANNVGLQAVTTDWVLFLNPDVRVGNIHDLHRLAAVSAANGGSLVAPQLLNVDGSRQPNGRGLPYLADKFANRSFRLPGARLHEYARTDLEQPTFVAWVMGAAVGGPTATMMALGGWDDRYFVYYEDHDLGLRGWSAGVPTVLDPTVTWQHRWQRSTSRPEIRPWVYELRSMARFYVRYPEMFSRRLPIRRTRWTALEHKVWSKANNAS